MDRLSRWALAGSGLALLLTVTGCRNLRSNQVPPERPYTAAPADGSAAPGAPAVGFSSEPPTNATSAAAQAGTVGAPGSGSMPAQAMPGLGMPGGVPAPPPESPQAVPGLGQPGGSKPGVMGQPGPNPSPL